MALPCGARRCRRRRAGRPAACAYDRARHRPHAALAHSRRAPAGADRATTLGWTGTEVRCAVTSHQNPVPTASSLHRVLVVDDDALSASVQSQLLHLLGYETASCDDGARAVELALSEPFDLVLLDLTMPDMDGFAVLRSLRDRERASGRPALPVIAVTGYVTPEDRARCLAAGFADHLHKPVQLSRMKRAVEHALGVQAAERRAGSAAAAPASDMDRLRAAAERLEQLPRAEGGFAPTVTEALALRSAQLIESARSAIEAREPIRAIRAAQALADNAQSFGATALSASAVALAQHCQAEDWDAASAGLRDFESRQQAALTVLLQTNR